MCVHSLFVLKYSFIYIYMYNYIRVYNYIVTLERFQRGKAGLSVLSEVRGRTMFF